MAPCRHANQCCFYERCKNRKSKAWTDLRRDYCEGAFSNFCQVKKHFLAQGTFVSDAILTPVGEIPEIFLKIP